MRYAKVLLIEDEIGIAEGIAHALAKHPQINFNVQIASDGEAGIVLAQQLKPDVVVLDLELPKVNGLSVLTKLHKEQPGTKVCILTANFSLEAKIATFQNGGDDFLIKPFTLEELILRITALLRRGRILQENRLLCGKVEIIISSRKVYYDDVLVNLTKTEFNLLLHLMQRSGQVVSRGELLEEVWQGKDLFPNTVDAHIESLRQKIDKPFGQEFIRTAYREGYYLEEGMPKEK